MAKRYTITLDDGIADVMEDAADNLGIQTTKFCRDLILLQLNQMNLIIKKINKNDNNKGQGRKHGKK